MTALHERADETSEHRNHRRLAIAFLLVLLALATPLLLWWQAGRTSASFADTEVLQTNHLGAATLDLEIGSSTVSFDATNLAPGDLITGQIELINAGTLPLLYLVSGTSDQDPLSDWLRFDVWRSDATCRPDDVRSLISSDIALTDRPEILLGDYAPVATESSERLAVGETTIVCLGARLLLDAPNTVQGRTTVVDFVIDAVHDIEATP
ncbi:MAG: TasA family protein [Acidimicrobiales bacterium]